MATNPHDELFKAVFSELTNARAEISALLPPDLVALLDLDALRPEPAEFIDAELRAQLADLLYSVPLRDDPARRAYVGLLFEHKSHDDPWVALQSLRYMTAIWAGLASTLKRGDWLPPLIPLLISHTATGWRSSLAFQDLFDPALLDHELVRRATPHFSLVHDDLDQLTNPDLLDRNLDSFGLASWLLMRDIRNLAALRDSAPLWGRHLSRLQRDPQTLARASQLLHYLVRSLPRDRRHEVAEMLHHTAPEAEQPFVSIYDHAIMTGEVKGMLKGKVEGRLLAARSTLRGQLARRFGALPPSVDARIDVSEVDALEAALLRIFDATSAEAVFEG